ncbi:SDR family oxidoreductase [Wenzhouxiangella sp. AB-CW3]|nr:SDR family oxidoreductase [Wenzhouxiangella sp. AB-CW3]
MNLDLSGRRALICGASQGIGAATASTLADCGATVTLLSRNKERLAAVHQTLPGDGHDLLALDLGDPAALADGLENLSDRHYHILIHNSGGPPAGRAIDAHPDEFEVGFHQHLIAGQRLAQALVPGMREAGYGRIVNIISTSVKEPIPGLGVSNTVRGAVAAWAKTLSRELGPDGITVNNVLPGFTETPRLDSLVAGKAKSQDTSEDQVQKTMLAGVPLGRFCKPEETAAAIAFLCSPLAGYITGINLPVDGGRLGSL